MSNKAYKEVENPIWEENKDQYYMYSNSHDKLGITYRLIHNEEAFECCYYVYEKVV